MPLDTVDAWGARSYGPIGRPPAGVVFHTPENVDHTLAQAIAIANWQATPTNASGGSYHGILGWDASKGGMDNPDAWVMVRSVPWDQASGGITGDHTPPSQVSPTTGRLGVWAPDRYPWVRQLLPAAALADPNRWLHQISLSGKASWYTANGYPSGLVTRIAEWVKTLEVAYGYDAVLMLHRHFQTDRSDPGPLDLPDLVLAEYARLYTPAPVPSEPAPPPPETPAQREIRIADEVVALRKAKPEAWAQWVANGGLTQADDGKLLQRLPRLISTAMYLREAK